MPSALDEVRLQSDENLHNEIRYAAITADGQVLMDGWFHIVLEPGDMTRYVLFGVPSAADKSWYIGYINFGAYEFPIEGWAHAGYVGEKLGVGNTHATKVVADFINLFMATQDG